jgi:hypothetical protein
MPIINVGAGTPDLAKRIYGTQDLTSIPAGRLTEGYAMAGPLWRVTMRPSYEAPTETECTVVVIAADASHAMLVAIAAAAFPTEDAPDWKTDEAFVESVELLAPFVIGETT